MARRVSIRRAFRLLAIGVVSAAAAAVLALGTCAPARADALFGDDVDVGGFAGPEVRISSLDGDLGIFLGAEGGWILNHHWIVGGAGYALINDHEIDFPPPAVPGKIDMGYGGLYLGYAADAEKLAHFTAGLVIGGGGADLKNADLFFDLEDTGDAFFVLEPHAGLEINLRENVHLKIDGGYRLIAGSDIVSVSDADLSGASFGLGVRVGSF